jgi:hypothetical protein
LRLTWRRQATAPRDVSISFLLLASMAAAGVSLSQSIPGPRRVLGVCEAVKVKTTELVWVRGLGRVGEDGFIIFDHTCPVIPDANPPVVATIVFAEIPAGWSRLRDIMVSQITDLQQMEVEGRISCVDRLRLGPNGISGNGFGIYGRVPCKLKVTKTRRLERWW